MIRVSGVYTIGTEYFIFKTNDFKANAKCYQQIKKKMLHGDRANLKIENEVTNNAKKF